MPPFPFRPGSGPAPGQRCVCRAEALSSAASAAAALLLSLAGLGAPLPGRGQDLVGCSLVDGQLSCVPGVSSDPQAQIRALRQTIAGDLAQENAVQQQIDGLEQLALVGELAQGSLLLAALPAGVAQDPLIALPAGAFHWYRLPAGASNWVLIAAASGPTYRLQAEDVGSQLMVVVARPTPQGSQRQASPAVGPVQPPASP